MIKIDPIVIFLSTANFEQRYLLSFFFIYLNINLTCGKCVLRLLPGKSLHPPTSGKAVLQDR
jgi:hypothetical protein